MDNLILIRVAQALDRELSGSALREVREESTHRLRIFFAGPERVRSVLLSLRPELPWIGRPAGRWEGLRRRTAKLAAALNRALEGTRLDGVEKPTVDRWVRFRFADGQALVAELATHGANLVLVDAGGRNVVCARRPKSARDRLVPGEPYRPPSLPRGLLDPFHADPGAVDDLLEEHRGGDEPLEILRRRIFGLGTQGARLVLEESRRSGRTPGQVLVDRLRALRDGELDPVILGPADPIEAAEQGDLDPSSTLLLPWAPPDPARAAACRQGADPASTAGRYHDALERAAQLDRRLAGLRTLLAREIERLDQAVHRVDADLSGFEDPERYRRQGEALLAGLAVARRVGEALLVPDPYDPDGGEMAVPVRPGQTAQQAAEERFQMHRRARRGLEQARRRRSWLSERCRKLQEVDWRHEGRRGLGAVRSLEEAMRGEGLPVGLEPDTRAGRAAARQAKPRLEGVRIYTSSDGVQILVGRSGKDNHRLTFKLAGPEDFWLHAQGCPGAHVIVRNMHRKPRPPRETLLEAAALAAWFSEARNHEYAEVHWTRRKYVRRPRGAPLGTVVLKRSETIRVRPARPPEDGAGIGRGWAESGSGATD